MSNLKLRIFRHSLWKSRQTYGVESLFFMVITQPKNQPQWSCLIPLPIHTITSGINRIVVQHTHTHTHRVREAMWDKRLWQWERSLMPVKHFEMKEMNGKKKKKQQKQNEDIEGGNRDKEERKLGRTRMWQVGQQMPKAGVKPATSWVHGVS